MTFVRAFLHQSVTGLKYLYFSHWPPGPLTDLSRDSYNFTHLFTCQFTKFMESSPDLRKTGMV